MIRKTLIALSLTTASLATLSVPAHAGGRHKHYCSCGHSGGGSKCGTTTSSGGSTTSGGTTTSSGGTTTTSGGTTTTSGGSSGGSSSGGTAVPEPGMLGMMGMGLVALAYARRRKARA